MEEAARQFGPSLNALSVPVGQNGLCFDYSVVLIVLLARPARAREYLRQGVECPSRESVDQACVSFFERLQRQSSPAGAPESGTDPCGCLELCGRLRLGRPRVKRRAPAADSLDRLIVDQLLIGARKAVLGASVDLLGCRLPV